MGENEEEIDLDRERGRRRRGTYCDRDLDESPI